MNIGKFSFNEIIKCSFDKAKVLFAAKGLFVIFLISMIFNLVSNTIINSGLDYRFTMVIDTLSMLICTVGAVIVIIGTTLLVKGGFGKSKAKMDLSAGIKSVFWRAVGVAVLYVLSIALLLLAAYGLGYLVLVPFVGLYLMGILAVPAIALFAMLAVYVLIVGKLLVIAVIENPKKRVWDIFTGLVVMTRDNSVKLMFNCVLSLIPMLLFILAALIVFAAAVMLYLFLGWSLPGMISLLLMSIQSGSNSLSLLMSLGGAVILAYAGAYVVVLSISLFYSIYLDAAK